MDCRSMYFSNDDFLLSVVLLAAESSSLDPVVVVPAKAVSDVNIMMNEWHLESCPLHCQSTLLLGKLLLSIVN